MNDYNCNHFFKQKTLDLFASKGKNPCCEETTNEVPISQFAFSQPLTTQLNRSIDEIKEIVSHISETQKKQLRLEQQYFIQLFNKLVPNFPNMFFLRPVDSKERIQVDGIYEKTYYVVFICQMPDCWHIIDAPVPQEHECLLRLPREVILKAIPWLNRVVKLVKFIPLGAAVAQFGLSEQDWNTLVKEALLLKETAKITPRIDQLVDEAGVMMKMLESDEGQITGHERAALELLQSKISKKCFEKLIYPFTTPEGQFIWVCEKHREQLQKEQY
ncbi:MAG: hypothetical protein ACFFCZ_11860 [Promethearchaeota archaeon]